MNQQRSKSLIDSLIVVGALLFFILIVGGGFYAQYYAENRKLDRIREVVKEEVQAALKEHKQ